MARLEGHDFQTPLKWFRLTPATPVIPSQSNSDYELAFWPGPSNTVFTRTFSVAGWQTEHDSVWVLARAFAEAQALSEATLDLDLWRTRHKSAAYIYESCDWLRVAMWGNQKQHQNALQFFVQDGDDTDIFRAFFMRVSVAQSQQFGRQLEEEIIAANPKWWGERSGRNAG